jgi:hypothetical protein
LVTRSGEDILADLDDWAVTELRRLKLVWQAWGPMISLTTNDFSAIPETPWGLRRVAFSDAPRMRRFFLSLLWRAAETSLPEFEEVQLRASDLRRLRRAVRGQVAPNETLFPVTLVQLSSRGPNHNMAAIKQMKVVPSVMGSRATRRPIIRMFFDGLIVHFHTEVSSNDMDGLYPMLVGGQEGTTITTVTSEASWQIKNLSATVTDTEYEFPGDRLRAGGGA